MKPKTILQKKLSPIASSFKGLTKDQSDWAFKNCVDHIGVRLKTGKTTCLDCAHVFELKTDNYVLTDYQYCNRDKQVFEKHRCPNCKANLQIHNTKRKVFEDYSHYNVITTYKGYQIVMICKIFVRYSAGKQPWINNRGTGEIWICPDGKHECFGYYATGGYGYYGINWSGDWELRNKNLIVNYSMDTYKTYPKIKLVDNLKRLNIPADCYGMKPAFVYKALLGHTCFETLIKADHIPLARHFINKYPDKMDKYWPSLKICLKHKYDFSKIDVEMWTDHINLLRMFDKDLHSPKYIMPKDLRMDHDRLIAKRNRINAQQDYQKRLIEMEDHQVLYKKQKEKFFGLEFIQDDISIKVLDSVFEFLEEGSYHNHCIFTNGYYKRENSLLFSAKVNDVRMETIEISLQSFKILQCRGKSNLPSKYHKKILALMEANIDAVKEAAKPKRKKPSTNVQPNAA